MIVILKQNAKQEQIDKLIGKIKSEGFDIHYSSGSHEKILGIIGNTAKLNTDDILLNDAVSDVRRVSEPYKLANKKFHKEDTVIKIGDAIIGGNHFCTIAGPCSVENEEQIVNCAKAIKKSGAKLLRGGAFKPRSSPYAFRGLKAHGIELLKIAKQETGLPIVSELTSIENLELFDDVDVIQVGARNMQNFDMLSELGKCKKPILLKRGLSSTIEEWLMSAEYIMAGGNENVILCERGIRTFETATRNTLDISAVPVLKELTHLPIIVDPSHATGDSKYVYSMAKTTVVAGANGVMIEVHPNPSEALCDGKQSITPEMFDKVMTDIKALLKLENKEL